MDFTGTLPGKTFEENWQCFESVPFSLYQLLAFRGAFLPICHTGVAFVLRVSCVIMTGCGGCIGGGLTHLRCGCCFRFTRSCVTRFLSDPDVGCGGGFLFKYSGETRYILRNIILNWSDYR